MITKERVLPRKNLQEVRSAFDVRSFWGLEEDEIRKLLIEYLPSYVIEQGDQTLREKTTTGVWWVENSEVIHPTLGPVINYISQETARDKQEFEAFTKIRDYLVEAKPGSIVCWFSPATSSEFSEEDYIESRTVVYFLEEEEEEKRVRWFEFCGHNSFEEQRQIASQFRAYSEKEYHFPNLEKMRTNPILLEGVSLQGVVEGVASYRRAWGDITSGKVTARMQKVINAATEVAPEAAAQIKKAAETKRKGAAIWAGAIVEREMEVRLHWNISFLGGCGFSNNALLSLMGVETGHNFQNRSYLTLGVNENKVFVLSFRKEKKYFGKCPICGYVIAEEKAISAGERCPGCGNIYEGC